MRSFRTRGGWWVVAQVAILAVAGWALVAGPARVDPGDPWSAILLVGGGAVLAGGAVLVLAGSAALGPGLTPFPAPLAGADLVERGPYRLVRHPIYGGVSLAVIGAGIAAAEVLALGMGLLLVGFFVAKSRYEERQLATAYPGYDAYRRRVLRRLIPFVL